MNNDIDRLDLPTCQEKSGLTRRHALAASGVTLAGAFLIGCETTRAQAARPQSGIGSARITTGNGGTKPIFLAEPGATDPVSHSLAENLFWTDILMEHAKFFVMLMPGPELAAQRRQAEQFQATFAGQFEKARSAGLDSENFAAFNRSTIEHVKRFVDFKRTMQHAQESGKLQSLVWPLFFDHTAREGERSIRRLGQLSGGTTELDRAEVVDFWAQIMGDHSAFIAHLLDPQEAQLIAQATQTRGAFADLRKSRPSLSGAAGGDPVLRAAEEIVDFKTAAEKGIEAGEIKSIIHPAIADHVRREAVKFVDELKRVG
jgi:hypothetical protein